MRIEDFQFEKSLMQKHFNENYMESHIYPEARLTGTISRQGPHFICNAIFDVRLEDYDIRIPRLLLRNIAETVEVTVNLRLVPVN